MAIFEFHRKHEHDRERYASDEDYCSPPPLRRTASLKRSRTDIYYDDNHSRTSSEYDDYPWPNKNKSITVRRYKYDDRAPENYHYEQYSYAPFSSSSSSHAQSEEYSWERSQKYSRKVTSHRYSSDEDRPNYSYQVKYRAPATHHSSSASSHRPDYRLERRPTKLLEYPSESVRYRVLEPKEKERREKVSRGRKYAESGDRDGWRPLVGFGRGWF